jgi:hypothetical protein
VRDESGEFDGAVTAVRRIARVSGRAAERRNTTFLESKNGQDFVVG